MPGGNVLFKLRLSAERFSTRGASPQVHLRSHHNDIHHIHDCGGDFGKSFHCSFDGHNLERTHPIMELRELCWALLVPPWVDWALCQLTMVWWCLIMMAVWRLTWRGSRSEPPRKFVTTGIQAWRWFQVKASILRLLPGGWFVWPLMRDGGRNS